MIKVDRLRVDEPHILTNNNKNPRGEKNRVIKHVEIDNKALKDFNFRIYKDPRVKEALKKLFYDKCAYCESIFIHNSHGEIEHWRPKQGVKENQSHKGYYWLASEWDNLLWACSICNYQGNKGNRFPLEAGSTHILKSTDNINLESPLLINPCENDPEEHIKFTKEGVIFSETLMGVTSIKVYGLDRSNLTAERRKSASELERYIKDILIFINELTTITKNCDIDNPAIKEMVENKKSHIDDKFQALKIRLQDDTEFLGMNNFLIKKTIKENEENIIFCKLMTKNLDL